MASADELKNKGNQAFSAGDYDQAINWFSQAIKADPTNHILYSNRSGAYAAKSNFGSALNDAKECVKLNPQWAKGYSRLGTAYFGLEDYNQALHSYEDGLKIEPNNTALLEGKQQVTAKFQSNPLYSLMALFQDNVEAKIGQHPKLSEYLKQPDFVQMLDGMKKSPQAVQMYIQDPRIREVLGFLTGIPTSMPEDRPSQPPKPKQPEKPKEPEKELTPEEKEAEELKSKGNDAYRSKNFDLALDLWKQAFDKNPKSIMYLNNRAACYFEMGKLDECIKQCEEAIEIARPLFNQPDNFKNVAKAWLRMGKAYDKQGNFEKALECGSNSITEEKTREAAEFNQRVERQLKEKQRLDYIDPEKSVKAREEGNEHFKKAQYPQAVKCYEEAIKRNPQDPVNYSNRAATYTKMMEYHLGLKDCEEGLKLKPDFAKLHVRKGHIHFFLKEYQKALEHYDQALRLEEKLPKEEHNPEIPDSINRTLMAMQQRSHSGAPDEETLKAASRDPEVIEIMQDPVMQQILNDMSTDPKAAKDHMQNPLIRKKIQKLVDAGVVRLG